MTVPRPSSRPAGRAFGLAALAAVALAAPQAARGDYADYVAWADWARVTPDQSAGLASSWDRTGGHFDANQYESPPGLVIGDLDVVAATLTGPGIIERFWMPHFAAAQPFAIRMYFDGEATPRIATDSGALLGANFAYFASPLVTTFAGGQVCYEPIPFRESLRIETQNRSGKWHWYHYNYRRLPPGTDIASWSGTLDAETAAARSAAMAIFASAGQHPAGASPTAVRSGWAASAVPAAGARTIVDAAGPGTIRWIGLAMPGAADAALDSLILRVAYDGQATPAIEAAVSDFFGAGHGRAPYRSLPLGTDSPDGFYCYWPMPFHAAAKLELVNLSAVPIPVDSVFVEIEPGDPGAAAGYLHVVVRDHRRSSVEQWNVMATVTGTGSYVGNFLSIRQGYANHSFLEGDDLVIVDGADSLHGTGVEDAYNGGFYYNWVTNPMPEPEGPSPPSAFRPLSGILRVEKTTSPAFARADQYRWMIADRVPFRSSLSVAVETAYATVFSEWRSVVFWYLLPEIAAAARVARDAARSGISLDAIAPNPASGEAVVRFSLARRADIVLELLDVAGRRLETLRSGTTPAGSHEVVCRRGTRAAGVYFVRLASGAEIVTRKIVLVD